MNKQGIDDLLSAIISSGDGISDLLFTPGKPPLVESYGSLNEFSIETPTDLARTDAPKLILLDLFSPGGEIRVSRRIYLFYSHYRSGRTVGR